MVENVDLETKPVQLINIHLVYIKPTAVMEQMHIIVYIKQERVHNINVVNFMSESKVINYII